MSSPRYRQMCGLATITGAVVFGAVVFALQAAQSGYDVRSQLMSELALGDHGSWMIVAFLGLAVSSAGLGAALLALPRQLFEATIFLSASIAFLGSGIATLRSAPTLHIVLISVAFISIVLGMYLVPRTALLRARRLRVTSNLLAIFVAAFVAAGSLGIDMGVAQRLAATSLLLWFILVGWHIAAGKNA